MAADRHEAITTRPWQTGLKLLPNASRSRNVILDDDTVRRLIAKAYEKDPNFGLLIEVAAVTGARVSQLSKITVADVRPDPARLLIPCSDKGRGQKKTTHTSVPITDDLMEKFDLTRPTGAPLLVKKDGRRWGHGEHTYLFQCLAKCSGLDPKVVTMYALRHSSIVRQLNHGVPIRVVAAVHDTSVQMIERTYSKHIADHADSLVRAALL
jgi:integrase